MKVEIDYEELTTIDTSELDESSDINQTSNAALVFEIGKTSMHTKDFTTQVIRVKIQ